MSSKMVKCKSCGNEIAANAKSCPSCGAKNSKPIFKKWWFWLVVVVIVVALIGSLGGDESTTDNNNDNQNGVAETTVHSDTKVGRYEIEIKNARLTTNYEGKPVVVVTYGFTNNSSEPAAFFLSVEDGAYQNGVGLEKAYVLNDNDPYDEANQNKEIKTGVTIDVDVAYLLNDTETDVDIEVKEFMSFSDDMITKSFSIK